MDINKQKLLDTLAIYTTTHLETDRSQLDFAMQQSSCHPNTASYQSQLCMATPLKKLHKNHADN